MKPVIIIGPIIVLAVLVGLFGRPKGEAEVTKDFRLPEGVELLHTTNAAKCETEVGIDEFGQLLPFSVAMIDVDKNQHLRVVYLVNDAIGRCITATDKVLIDPSFGQAIDNWQIDEEQGEVTAKLVTTLDGAGPDAVEHIPPIVLYIIGFGISGIWALLSYLGLYTG